MVIGYKFSRKMPRTFAFSRRLPVLTLAGIGDLGGKRACDGASAEITSNQRPEDVSMLVELLPRKLGGHIDLSLGL